MGEIYRDRSEGTVARRQELLRRRRDELVTMPHAVRRVVVARTARVAASRVLAAAGVALLLAAAWPALTSTLADVMPGDRPAPRTTLLFGAWMIGVIAWAISRARVEHRFAVAMSRYVLPSHDPDHDVERLDHERPDAIARAMGHALEVRSAAWPLLAAGLLLPATVLWLSWLARAGGWPVADVEDDLGRTATTLAAFAAVGALAAMAVTLKATRERRAAALAAGTALVAGALGLGGLVTVPVAGWFLLGLAGAALAVAVVVRVLVRERALLAIEDPAAGSEELSLRDLLRGLARAARARLTVARAALLRVPPRYAALAVAAGLVSVGIGLTLRDGARPTPATAPVVAALAAAVVVAAAAPAVPSAPAVTVEPGAALARTVIGDRYRLEVTLDEHGERVVPLGGLAVVPLHWQADLEVSSDDDATVRAVQAAHPDGRVVTERGATRVILRACHGDVPLALRLSRPGAAGQRVTLQVTPRLGLARC